MIDPIKQIYSLFFLIFFFPCFYYFIFLFFTIKLND